MEPNGTRPVAPEEGHFVMTHGSNLVAGSTSLLLAATALAGALALATPAAAWPVDVSGDNQDARETVRYTNAERHTERGARTIALRIRVAADRVCGGADPIVRTGDGFQTCKKTAIDRALEDLDAPLVTQAMGRPPSGPTDVLR
jgi:UrcA family protein